MNSIIFTHVATRVADVSITELALDRLGAWLDAGRDTLEHLLAQAGQRQAANALEVLDQLHLEPNSTADDLRCLLDDARSHGEVLLETLRAIPSCCHLETAWGLLGPDAFDSHVRWSGARLEDVVAMLDYALVA